MFVAVQHMPGAVSSGAGCRDLQWTGAGGHSLHIIMVPVPGTGHLQRWRGRALTCHATTRRHQLHSHWALRGKQAWKQSTLGNELQNYIETVSAGDRSARSARLGVHPIWWR